MKIIYMLIIIFNFLFAPTNKTKYVLPVDIYSEQKQIDEKLFDTTMPEYLKIIVKEYGLDKAMMYRLSWTESRHTPEAISDKLAYGRYQISKCFLDDYMRYRGKLFPKHWEKFLLTDIENCRIVGWTFWTWGKIGFSDRECIQAWLFGLRGVYENDRYSEKYESNVFYYVEKPFIRNFEAYCKYTNGNWFIK